jgi:hypothetical protein
VEHEGSSRGRDLGNFWLDAIQTGNQMAGNVLTDDMPVLERIQRHCMAQPNPRGETRGMKLRDHLPVIWPISAAIFPISGTSAYFAAIFSALRVIESVM